MRKIASLLFFFLPPLLSSPVGNPASPQLIQEGIWSSGEKWVNFRLGYEGNFVGDGKMEKGGMVDRYRESNQGASLTINVLDRIDLYALLGASSTEADFRFGMSPVAIARLELKTPYTFFWAGGGEAHSL